MSDSIKGPFNGHAGTDSNLIIPTVIRDNPQGGRTAIDVYSRMLDSNVVFVSGQVEPNMASTIVAQLLHLYYDRMKERLLAAAKMPGGIEGNVPEKDRTIKMFINSPGGYVNDGLQIYDLMQLLQAEGVVVETHVTGIAMSMGSILLVAGSPGHRHAWPSANIMLHQVSGGAQGKVTDMNISHEESKYINERLKDIYRVHTALTDSEIEKIFTNDYYLRAEEAKKLGIIDSVQYPEHMPRVKEMLERQNFRHMEGEEVVQSVKQMRVRREVPPAPVPANNN